MVKTLVNGRTSDSVSVTNRGLAYADGLFETVKVVAGKAEFINLHLQRLQRGCDQLKIHCDMAAIRRDTSQLLAAEKAINGVLKITVTRGYTGRGYQFDSAAGSDRIVALSTDEHDYSVQQGNGVSARFCDTRLAVNPALATIKHLAKLENVLARAEWSDEGIAEGILLDTAGRVIEGTMSNIFIVSQQQLLTPALHRCGVAGIIRQLIIEQLCPQLQVSSLVRDISVDEVVQADEVFFSNSLIGLWPVIAIGSHRKAIGPVTRKLQQALMQCDYDV